MTTCGCNRALAGICALFASLATCLFLAQAACHSLGGRVSDADWICEMAGGASASLWTMVSPGIAVLAVMAVGIPVFLAVYLLGRLLISACGLGER